MPMHVTIVLDSGAFLQNIDEDPSELDVGYFQCDSDHGGNPVPDIRAYAGAEATSVREEKLGKGRINVVRTSTSPAVTGIRFSHSLKQNLLRKRDLYSDPVPDYNRGNFDCTIHFTSGNFRCSKVKDRRFKEVSLNSGEVTGNEQFVRPIAHDVVVHFHLADGEELRLERSDGTVLFSTTDVVAGSKHVEIELLANNSTAVKFFRDALDLTGRASCWLPNQGDPTTTGSP